MIIIVCGLPGSGKSYFASRLAEMINSEYVNSDRIRKEMFRERTYTEQEKAKVYDAMLERMKEAMNQKKNLVLDATFHKKETRKPFIEKTKGKGNIFFIEVRAGENIIRERLKKSRPYSDADFEVYKLIRQQWESLKEPHLLLESNNENIEIMLQKSVDYLHLNDD